MDIFETERLVIKQATLNDSNFFFRLLNSPNWIEFIGDRGIKTEEDARTYIRNSLIDSYEKRGYGLYKMCLRENEVPIGICGFLKRDYLENVDIGFAVLPEYEGKGYTLEASKSMLEFGKLKLNMDTILAITTKENIKSRSLLQKIGLTEVGKIKPNEKEEELLLYST
jgi:RimJ/RimL family protein N-acetyltransferase